MESKEAAEFVSSLFEAWYPALVRYAYRASGSLEFAEDAVQEAMFSLYCALEGGQTIANAKAWTLCVVRREVTRQLQSYRHAGVAGATLDEVESCLVSPAPPVDEMLQWDEVFRLISVLTRREEEVLLLRLQPMKYKEIAEELGISRTSVNTLLSRAIRKLQKAWQDKSRGQGVLSEVRCDLSKPLQ
jgi:RNA polymerase sigma factor (sigma-70 family)